MYLTLKIVEVLVDRLVHGPDQLAGGQVTGGREQQVAIHLN